MLTVSHLNIKYIKLIIFFLLLSNCTTLKKANKKNGYEEKQASIHLDYEIKNENIRFNIKNTLHSPIRIALMCNDETLTKRFDTLTVRKLTDTIYNVRKTNIKDKNLQFWIVLGDLKKKIIKQKLELPFSYNKSYKILQSHNGAFSHNEDNSRFAIDFAMKTGDTVLSADNGYVVGIIDKNDKYGNNKKFEKFANYITTYNDSTGIYCQYVHLQKNKIFVKVGDKIKRNQPLGLVGKSGFIDGEHLHFNTLVACKLGITSTPSDFIAYFGNELTKGMIVNKKSISR